MSESLFLDCHRSTRSLNCSLFWRRHGEEKEDLGEIAEVTFYCVYSEGEEEEKGELDISRDWS